MSSKEEPRSNITYGTAVGKLGREACDRLLTAADRVVEREAAKAWLRR